MRRVLIPAVVVRWVGPTAVPAVPAATAGSHLPVSGTVLKGTDSPFFSDVGPVQQCLTLDF